MVATWHAQSRKSGPTSLRRRRDRRCWKSRWWAQRVDDRLFIAQNRLAYSSGSRQAASQVCTRSNTSIQWSGVHATGTKRPNNECLSDMRVSWILRRAVVGWAAALYRENRGCDSATINVHAIITAEVVAWSVIRADKA
jgi:hypothetical protein